MRHERSKKGTQAMTSPMNAKRVALVTGASFGIGEAIVGRLLSDGLTVYGAARRVVLYRIIYCKYRVGRYYERGDLYVIPSNG